MNIETVPYIDNQDIEKLNIFYFDVPSKVTMGDFRKLILKTDSDVKSFKVSAPLSYNPAVTAIIQEQLDLLAYSLYHNSTPTEGKYDERCMFSIPMEGWSFEVWVREIYSDTGEVDVQLVLADMWGDPRMQSYSSDSYRQHVTEALSRVRQLNILVDYVQNNRRGIEGKFNTWSLLMNGGEEAMNTVTQGAGRVAVVSSVYTSMADADMHVFALPSPSIEYFIDYRVICG